jgi:WD40 repeat protein
MATMKFGIVEMLAAFLCCTAAAPCLAAKEKNLAGPSAQLRTDAHGDPLPPGALLRLGTLRWRAATRSLAFTPDGKTLVVGDYGAPDDVIRCLDTATGKETASFRAPGRAWPFALPPDGKTLAVDATQQQEHALLLVSVPEGKVICRIEAASTNPGANLYYLRLDFSPDGKTLAAVGNDSVCRLFDVETGKTILHLTGEVKTGGRYPTAFSPDGKKIALVGQQNTLRLVEIATEKEVFKRQARQDDEYRLLNMSFSPDGKKLAWVGEDDKTFALWDIASGEPVLQFRGSPDRVESVHFSADGKRIAAVYSDSKEPPPGLGFSHGGSIRLWDAETAKELRTLLAPSCAIETVVFSQDGQRLAGGDDQDGVVHLWDVETGKELSRTGEHQGVVCSAAFSADGRTALTGCVDRVIRLWDADRGALTRRVEVGQDGNPGLFQIHYSNDRKSAAVVNPRGGGEFWDLSAGSRRAVLEGDGVIFEAHFAPDGKTLAARGMFPNVRLWDAQTGKLTSRVGIDSNGLGSFAFSPDGRTILAQHDNHDSHGSNISFWDAALDKELRSWPAPPYIFPVAFSPDGRTVVAARGGEVNVWDVVSGRELSRMTMPTGEPVQGFLEYWALSPDGRTLAAGSYSGAISLWEVSTARSRGVLTGHRARISSLDFSPDGARLISSSNDTTALIWDLTSIADDKDTKTLSSERLASLWEDLADADAGKAWRAGWRLTADPAASLPFLQKHLRPVEVDARRVTKLLAALDGDDFDKREEASRELAKLGDLAGPAVRKVLEGDPSSEARRRLEELAGRLDGPVQDAEEVRSLRGVEALEHIGTVEARRLLDELAKGAPGAHQTREALAAAARLAGAPSPSRKP